MCEKVEAPVEPHDKESKTRVSRPISRQKQEFFSPTSSTIETSEDTDKKRTPYKAPVRNL